MVDLSGGLPEPFAKDLSRMPPVLALHGGRDNVVPVAEAYRLQRWMKRAGRPCQVHVYPSEGHGFSARVNQDAWARVVRFLDRYVGKLARGVAPGRSAAISGCG